MFKLLLVSLELALVLICPYSCMLADAVASSLGSQEQHVCPCCEKCADHDHPEPQDDQDGGRGECFCKGAIVLAEHAADVPDESQATIFTVDDSIIAAQCSSSREGVRFHRGYSHTGRPLRLSLGSLQI